MGANALPMGREVIIGCGGQVNVGWGRGKYLCRDVMMRSINSYSLMWPTYGVNFLKTHEGLAARSFRPQIPLFGQRVLNYEHEDKLTLVRQNAFLLWFFAEVCPYVP